MSGAAVYHLPEMSAFLKVSKVGGFSDLGREREVLMWLEGKAPVPSVLGYQATDEHEYLLSSEILGTAASELLSADRSTAESELTLLREAAITLRQLHEIPIDSCSLDQRLDIKFERARKNIEQNLLSETEEEFAREHDGKRPAEILRELSAARPAQYDLVFTHGDPCMPNIIVDADRIAGFIDLDGAGVADRYTDIAIFFRSFVRNCRVQVNFPDMFCEAYGIDRLDADKMRFYSLLDDLF